MCKWGNGGMCKWENEEMCEWENVQMKKTFINVTHSNT